jgi:hypothetical protein
MDDIRLNGKLAWMRIGMSAWCVIKATEHAYNGSISWPSLRYNQKWVKEQEHRSSDNS